MHVHPYPASTLTPELKHRTCSGFGKGAHLQTSTTFTENPRTSFLKESRPDAFQMLQISFLILQFRHELVRVLLQCLQPQGRNPTTVRLASMASLIQGKPSFPRVVPHHHALAKSKHGKKKKESVSFKWPLDDGNLIQLFFFMPVRVVCHVSYLMHRMPCVACHVLRVVCPVWLLQGVRVLPLLCHPWRDVHR